MKHSIIAAVAVAALTMATAGCGVIKPKASNTIKGSSATMVVYPSTTAPNLTGGEPGPAILPAENSAQSTPLATATPASAPSGAQNAIASQLGGGKWEIIRVGNTIVDRDEDMPYLTFEPATGHFYGNDGCNTINGSYRMNGQDVIMFYGVLSTMRDCPDVTFDRDIAAVINDATASRLKISTVGQETFIGFFNGEDKMVMQIRRGELAFLNGNWKIETVAGLGEPQVPADIFFDLGELKLHGNTGCNYFNGSIYLDHRESNAVDFSQMGVTRMACPYTAQETAILVALEQTAKAIEGGPDKVMLLDGAGHELMTLSRLPIDESADE